MCQPVDEEPKDTEVSVGFTEASQLDPKVWELISNKNSLRDLKKGPNLYFSFRTIMGKK